MLVKFETSKNEVEEDERDAVEEGLDYPGPEGHVDVDNVSLLPIPNDFLKKTRTDQHRFQDCSCHDPCHCPAPFTYFGWQKGYFQPFPFTVGIFVPSHFFVIMFVYLVLFH